MERTEKVCAEQSVQPQRQERQRSAYLPPAIETVDIGVEKGFAGSIEEIPDTPWETY